MITISDILIPEYIDLDLKFTNQEELVHHIAMLLRPEPNVKDWQGFYDGLKATDVSVLEENGVRLCIPHVRSKSVKMMVMAAGRSEVEQEAPASKSKPFVQYTFVIGVPHALASDYLRIIGALARIFKDQSTEAQLRSVENPEEFLAILTRKEMHL